MNKTKIEWCDSTWNPVTGCRHGCEYCYARRVAQRFGKEVPDRSSYPEEHDGLHCLENKFKDNPYPYIFEPTFHTFRLNEPQHKTKPLTIFVCSMADLFGDWVPNAWIEEVFSACKNAPQHRYLFLTKNPARYVRLAEAGSLPKGKNFWYGSSTPTPNDSAFQSNEYNTFLSVEPILERFPLKREPVSSSFANWVILGAMTGPGSTKYVPARETVENIVGSVSCAVFMKESLCSIIGEENMRRELPWRDKP